jgi:hypothetical protein
MKTLSFFAAALLFMGISTMTQGQETVKTNTTVQEKNQVAESAASNAQRPYYVDKDNNGVCDNFEAGNGRQGRRLGQGQGFGKCQGQGKGLGRGQGRGGNGNFVDANNDGICDNQQNGTAQQRLRDGSGNANTPTK